MPRLVDSLALKGNPFEHYVAETEPDIADYAVKPPYFQAIDARAANTSSFILFGDRGAGKSATRLTVFKELWKNKADGKKAPFAINFTDFSATLSGKQITDATEKTIIKEVGFMVIESLLTWLSSFEKEERQIYLGAMNDEEKKLCYLLLRDYYLDRPDSKRAKSVREAMILFNQAFLAKNKLWIERRWEPIANLIGTITDAIAHQYIESKENIAPDITAVISKDKESDFDSILLLRRLVDLIEIFDFSGVVILVDKVDETDATNNSVERTAELIYPLLARIQLMEVEKLSFIFFLWSSVKSCFEGEQYPVRLDKLGHATVSWEDKFFAIMLDKRMQFYSGGKLKFSDLFVEKTNLEEITNTLMNVCMRSPREMIRLMDVIIREHDVAHSESDGTVLLDVASVQPGIDTYVKDRISSIYGERLLAQIFRINKTLFTNKEVQNTFKVGDQSARRKIQSWESARIIKLTGTRAAEGNLGGKPANEYTIIDARIERVMDRQLISYTDEVVAEEVEPDVSGS